MGVLWPQSNLKVLYHLENANDSSGNGKTLGLGSVSWVTAKFGIGAYCNASGYSGLWETTPGVLPAGDTTILSWVKFTSVPNANPEYLFTLYRADNKATIIYFNFTSPNTYLYVTHGGGTARGGTITPDTTKWHLVVVTVSSGGAICVYWDGVLIGSGNGGSTTTPTDNLLLFFRDTGGNGSLNATIDEAAGFQEVKSPQWIRQYYAWATGKMI